MTSAAVVAAVEARLSSVPLNLYSGAGAPPTYPYVTVYADGGIRSSDREADVRIEQSVGWQTTVTGSTPAQCRAALDALTAVLEDWVPVVAGRQCSKVDHEGSQPVRKDDELPDRVLFFATDQWRTVSAPV